MTTICTHCGGGVCNSSLTVGHLLFFPPFNLYKKKQKSYWVISTFLEYEMLSWFRDDHTTHGSRPLHNGMTTLFTLFSEAISLCGGLCSIGHQQQGTRPITPHCEGEWWVSICSSFECPEEGSIPEEGSMGTCVIGHKLHWTMLA